jgi:hypothetical protein
MDIWPRAMDTAGLDTDLKVAIFPAIACDSTMGDYPGHRSDAQSILICFTPFLAGYLS